MAQKNNDPIYWLIAIVLIFTGFASPIGVLMVVLKILSGGKKRGRHPFYEQNSGRAPTGARTTGPSAAGLAPPQSAPVQQTPPRSAPVRQAAPRTARKKSDPLARLDRRGKWMTRFGGLIAALFLVFFLSALGTPAYQLLNGNLGYFVEDLLNLMFLPCCSAAGLGMLWAGVRKRRQARSFRSYLAMIGQNTTMSVSALSAATGRSPDKVRDDLSDMLDAGLFPQGFLDYGGDRLVLSGGGITEPPKEEPAAPKGDENTVLAEIRAVSDAIQNEKMSAQIDRIGVITAKILDYQKSHPAKAPQLHSFLSYYLPTTLKILRAYAQLEAQEIAGENITAAMQRIEGMMDKVVEGFEKQLDLLFQGDAMDITTDVEVLERMLAKDGLSDRQGLTLEL